MSQTASAAMKTGLSARRRFAVPAAGALVLLAAGLLAGCGQVERTITVTSEPPGAQVVVNGVNKGRTPVTFDFLWYGDYRFELSLDGFETLKDHRQVRAPLHQLLGPDLLTEMLVPITWRDDKHFSFMLKPLAPVTEAGLIERADEMRDRTLHSER